MRSTSKQSDSHDWQINMADDAFDRFWEYVDLMPGEVGAFGYCTLDEEAHEVSVSEIFLVPQEVSGSEVDFVTDGIPYAIEKASREGRLEELRFCIHSHGTHGAFWSATDEDAIQKFGWAGTPWFANVIFNKRGESTGRIDIWHDLPILGRQQFTLKECGVNRPPTDEDSYAEAKAQLAEFVKTKTYTAPKKGSAQTGKSYVVGKASGSGQGAPSTTSKVGKEIIKVGQQMEAPPTIEVVQGVVVEDDVEPELIAILNDVRDEMTPFNKLTIAKAKQAAADWHMEFFHDNNGRAYVMGFNGRVFVTFDRSGKVMEDQSSIDVPDLGASYPNLAAMVAMME